MLVLKGDLDELELDEVLRFLIRTRQTGCLRLVGVRGEVTLWVADGDVRAAPGDGVGRAPLDEVLCDVLRHEGGSFAFDSEGPPAPDGPTGPTGPAVPRVDVEDLLARAHALATEWRTLSRKIPSLDHRIRLAPTIPDDDHRTVTAHQWPTLVAIGRGTSIATLAARCQLSDLAALREAHDLITAGLAELAAPRPTSPNPSRRPATSTRR